MQICMIIIRYQLSKKGFNSKSNSMIINTHFIQMDYLVIYQQREPVIATHLLTLNRLHPF